MLEGRRAVITGGASGIGLAIAHALGERGCRLLLADIESEALDRATAALRASTEVVGVRTDVADRESVLRLAATVEEHFGGIDFLFLNAGVGVPTPVIDASYEDWAWTIAVNLWGPIHGVEAFLPRLVASGQEAHVFFTASFAGLVPNVGTGPYCVTKYGVVALAEVLHRELANTAVRISVICPMLVDTNVGNARRNRPQEFGGPESTTDTIADLRRLTRVIPPEEVAAKAIDAIGTDRLYVMTHEESRAMIARRFARIDAAFD